MNQLKIATFLYSVSAEKARVITHVNPDKTNKLSPKNHAVFLGVID